MAETNRGTFFSGAGLVWKWQRLVWWLFFVCLIFGFFSTHEMTERAYSLLNNSVAAQRLVNGFDVSSIITLQQLPDSPLEIQSHNIVHFSILFVVFMLFRDGRHPRRLRPRRKTHHHSLLRSLRPPFLALLSPSYLSRHRAAAHRGPRRRY